jgi:hypothetical protein
MRRFSQWATHWGPSDAPLLLILVCADTRYEDRFSGEIHE